MNHPLIGILGSGQLSRLLIEAALKRKIPITALCEDETRPAAKVIPHWKKGSFNDPASLRNFFSTVQRCIFENEFVDTSLIQNTSQDTTVQFTPPLQVIQTLQQKMEQKRVLQKLKIPTPPFQMIPRKDFESVLLKASKELSLPFVLKWNVHGYDGKGVMIVRSLQSQKTDIANFMSKADEKKVEVFAETFIPYVRELAIVATYAKSGEFISYPLVISEQKSGICFKVTGPARSLGVSANLEKVAQTYAKKLATDLKLTGTFAMEFFETKEGDLIVNEIAPRVHNTGHYSIDACNVSQFENHLFATQGLPLQNPQTRTFFIMLNLLGPDGFSKKTKSKDFLPKTENQKYPLACHWYEKEEIEPGRKLGHLTGQVRRIEDFEGLQKEMNGWHEQWIQNVKKL